MSPSFCFSKLTYAIADVFYTADILHNYVQRIYEERQYCKAMGLTRPLIKMQHLLVYYFGFSQQMRGIAYQQLGDYEQAKDSIYRYAELGWLEDLGKKGLEIAREFRFLAKVNLTLLFSLTILRPHNILNYEAYNKAETWL
ncbi:hypothetical protein NST99_33075 [Paenibacillus sp. FSL L8-0470]|uniref:hypothetical protein n=2 Tax=Paenibacillus TaxID=44249 RepID=UPI0030FABDC0